MWSGRRAKENKWYTSKLFWLLNNISQKYKFGFNHKFSVLNVSFIKSSPSSWIINFLLYVLISYAELIAKFNSFISWKNVTREWEKAKRKSWLQINYDSNLIELFRNPFYCLLDTMLFNNILKRVKCCGVVRCLNAHNTH